MRPPGLVGVAVGSFETPADEGLKLMECLTQGDSVTQTNANIHKLNDIVLTWTPPADDNLGQVHFV